MLLAARRASYTCTRPRGSVTRIARSRTAGVPTAVIRVQPSPSGAESSSASRSLTSVRTSCSGGSTTKFPRASTVTPGPPPRAGPVTLVGSTDGPGCTLAMPLSGTIAATSVDTTRGCPSPPRAIDAGTRAASTSTAATRGSPDVGGTRNVVGGTRSSTPRPLGIPASAGLGAGVSTMSFALATTGAARAQARASAADRTAFNRSIPIDCAPRLAQHARAVAGINRARPPPCDGSPAPASSVAGAPGQRYPLGP